MMPLWMLWMCPREEIVDTIERMLPLRVGVKKHRRTVEEKRAIIEETLEVGASLGRIARQHDVNANQVFYWRKLYREGRLGTNTSTRLLPVRVSAALYSRPW